MCALCADVEKLKRYVLERVLADFGPERIVLLDLEMYPPPAAGTGHRLEDKFIIGVGYATFEAFENPNVLAADSGKIIEYEEVRLLRELDAWLGRVKPLLLVGYGVTLSDIPLLASKVRESRRTCKHGGQLSNIADSLNALVLDLAQSVRLYLWHKGYEQRPRFLGLKEVLRHPAFTGVSFKTEATDLLEECVERSPYRSRSEAVGNVLARWWKEDTEIFEEYVKEDVYNSGKLLEFLLDRFWCEI